MSRSGKDVRCRRHCSWGGVQVPLPCTVPYTLLCYNDTGKYLSVSRGEPQVTPLNRPRGRSTGLDKRLKEVEDVFQLATSLRSNLSPLFLSYGPSTTPTLG